MAQLYAGKSLHLVIGYAPGGGYDLYARTLARATSAATSRVRPISRQAIDFMKD